MKVVCCLVLMNMTMFDELSVDDTCIIGKDQNIVTNRGHK